MPGESYRWECPECGTEHSLAPAVVELCHEHRTSCDDCGNRVAFDLSTRPL